MSDVTRGFKAKTIKQIIQSKLDVWAASIRCEDEDKKEALQKAIKDDVVVTGGCIASMLLGEMPNDFDVYFLSRESAILVAQHYLAEYLSEHEEEHNDKISRIELRDKAEGISLYVKSSGVIGDEVSTDDYQYFESLPPEYMNAFFKPKYYKEEKGKFHPTLFTDNAITLTDRIQIVLRFIGEPSDIHDNYDFAHCKNHYCRGELVLDPAAMEALLTRELRYVGSKFPVCSLFRIRKFLQRGFTICASEVFKIAYDVSLLDLENPEVLEDQLLGVDYAYFAEVISLVRERVESDKPLDRTYLFELVNRVFDEDEVGVQFPLEI